MDAVHKVKEVKHEEKEAAVAKKATEENKSED